MKQTSSRFLNQLAYVSKMEAQRTYVYRHTTF